MSTFNSKLVEKVIKAIYLSHEAVQSWYDVLSHLLKPAVRKWWSWQRTLTRRGLTIQLVLLLLLLVLRTLGPRLRRNTISWQRAIRINYLQFRVRVKKVRRATGRHIYVALPHVGFAVLCILIVRHFPAWTDRLADCDNMEKLAITVQSITSIFVIYLAESHMGGIDGRTFPGASSTPDTPVSSPGASATCQTFYLSEPRLTSSLMSCIALAMAITCHRITLHGLSWIPFGVQMATGVGAAKRIRLAYSLLLLWLQLTTNGSQLVCTYVMPHVFKYFPSAQATTNGNIGNGRRTTNTFSRLLAVLVWSKALSPASAQTLSEVSAKQTNKLARWHRFESIDWQPRTSDTVL